MLKCLVIWNYLLIFIWFHLGCIKPVHCMSGKYLLFLETGQTESTLLFSSSGDFNSPFCGILSTVKLACTCTRAPWLFLAILPGQKENVMGGEQGKSGLVPQLSLSLSLLLTGHHVLDDFPLPSSAAMLCSPLRSPEATETSDLGRKTLKPWGKMNLSYFKLTCEVFCHSKGSWLTQWHCYW